MTFEEYQDSFLDEDTEVRTIKKKRGYTKLIVQIIYSILPEGSRLRHNKSFFVFESNTRDYIDVKNCVDIYLKEFAREIKKQKEATLRAFIHVNNIYSPSPGKPSKKTISEEERQAMIRIIQGMDKTVVHKALN